MLLNLFKNIIFFLFVFNTFSFPVLAKHCFQEKDYQRHWCSSVRGQTEFILPDKTRVDCLINEYAIEFDFASKWAEAIGQSLYYALCTNKKPGIVLIIENRSKDKKYLQRLLKVSNLYNIKVWIITPQDIFKVQNPYK